MVFIRWKPRGALTTRSLLEHVCGKIKIKKKKKPVKQGTPWYVLPPAEQQKRLHLKRTGKQRHMIHQCRSLRDVKEVHKRLVEDGHDQDKVVRKLVVAKYQALGSMEGACKIFRSSLASTSFGCGILIAAYAQNGHTRDALRAFSAMDMQGIMPDEGTLSTVLGVCWSLRALEPTKEILDFVSSGKFAADEDFWSGLILLLAKFGRLEDARLVFDRLLVQGVVAWTAMAAAYARDGHFTEALDLLHRMDHEGIQPVKKTLVQLLVALSRRGGEALLAAGKMLHARCLGLGLKGDVHVHTALINMYSACGSLDSAKAIFDEIRWKNIFAGTSMMAAFLKHGQPNEALKLYRQIEAKNVTPRDGTLVAALAACAMLGNAAEGKRIHHQIVPRAEKPSPSLEAAIVVMYARCGSLDEALQAFQAANMRDKDAWTALMAAYAQKGHIKQVLELLRRMDQEGIAGADEQTMLCVLGGFGSSRLLAKAREYFHSIAADRWLEYTQEHYGCILQLLARGGMLDESEDLMTNMPFQPGPYLWDYFLAACNEHGDHMRSRRLAGSALTS